MRINWIRVVLLILRLKTRQRSTLLRHTSWIAVATPTDRPKSVCNRCLIEVYGGVFCFAFYTPVFRRDVLWYGDVRPGLRPSFRSPSAHFPHFSPTCFDTLSWNFAHDFVLMYYRSSSTVITLRHFFKELCLLHCYIYKYTYYANDFYTPVFRRDVLWYGDVRLGLRPGLRPSVRLSVRPVSVRPFSALFSYILWHIELKFCTWLFFMYYRSSSTVVTLRQFLKELCLFWNLE